MLRQVRDTRGPTARKGRRLSRHRAPIPARRSMRIPGPDLPIRPVGREHGGGGAAPA